MTTAFIGVDTADPRLPDVVMNASLPHVDVRTYGAVGDGTTDDTAAIQAAIDAVKYPVGGIVLLSIGTYRLNSGLTIDATRVTLRGSDPASTQLLYYGSGTAIDVTADGAVRLENFRLYNTGGTGLKGIVVGSSTNYTGFRYAIQRVDIFGFDTYGLHVANCELSTFVEVYVDGQTTTTSGIFADNSRHGLGANGGWNRFERCRVANCTSYGWDIDKQTGMRLTHCESLLNAGTAQMFVHGTTYCCTFEGLDCENSGAASTGLLISGGYHTIEGFFGFNLSKGVEFSAATGCYLGPARFSTVTTPLTIGGTCVDVMIYDDGLLGTPTEGAPEATHFIGKRIRSNRLEVSGQAGAGFIDFRNEQSADPAAASNRARLYTRDNAGKTELVVRFGTGAIQVIATEP